MLLMKLARESCVPLFDLYSVYKLPWASSFEVFHLAFIVLQWQSLFPGAFAEDKDTGSLS